MWRLILINMFSGFCIKRPTAEPCIPNNLIICAQEAVSSVKYPAPTNDWISCWGARVVCQIIFVDIVSWVFVRYNKEKLGGGEEDVTKTIRRKRALVG